MSRIYLALSLALIFALGLGASLLVYNATEAVAEANNELVDQAFSDLRFISRFRADLHEHERLAYELYAVIDAEQFRPLLEQQQQVIDHHTSQLGGRGLAFGGLDRLETHWRAIVAETEELMVNVGQPTTETDWDLARAQLKAISDERRAVAPLLDDLIEGAETRAHQAEEQTHSNLAFMSSLVMAYTGIILLIAAITGWMFRRLVQINASSRALAEFPARNPMPVITLSPDGVVHFANRSAQDFLQRINAAEDDLSGLVPDATQKSIHTALKHRRHGQVEGEVGGLCLAYHWYWLADRGIFHIYILDITTERRAEKQLRHMAYTDEVTGLMNRNALVRNIENHQPNGPACLGLLSIERFHLLPLSAGFRAADRVLETFGQQLLRRAREHFGQDVAVARIEGALFALFWSPANGVKSDTTSITSFMESLPRVLRRGRAFLNTGYHMGLRCTDSAAGADPDALLSDADAALRAAESRSRRNYAIHDQSIRERQQNQLDIEQRLRRALKTGDRGLELYLQPKVDLATHSITGAEALLRWHDPELGQMAPDTFIPIAEQSGLIIELGRWVLDQATALLSSWHHDPVLSRLHLAVNASADELQVSDYSSQIIDALERHDLSPDRLEIEVTERVLADIENSRQLDSLKQLRHHGLSISVDDFGTGYSSLAYLSQLPITHIKIDRLFVSQIPAAEGQAALADIIVRLARELHLDCVAEGVETASQADYLRQSGCRMAQGYFFSRPLPVGEFEALAVAPEPSRKREA